MNIGIFGGAFNPIHNGHLHLIDLLSDKIDKLIVIPTANPPHKSNVDLISGEHRINMLKLAIFENSNIEPALSNKIEISTIEFESEEKSYTYNTLKKLKAIYPNDNLFLFMGSDQLLNFHRWYMYKEIQELATIIAITRNESEQEAFNDYLAEHKSDVFNADTVIANPVVVSSTEIRNKVKASEDISTLVPNEVEKYIKDNNLYV